MQTAQMNARTYHKRKTFAQQNWNHRFIIAPNVSYARKKIRLFLHEKNSDVEKIPYKIKFPIKNVDLHAIM